MEPGRVALVTATIHQVIFSLTLFFIDVPKVLMLLVVTIKSVVPRRQGKGALLNQTVQLGQLLQCLTLTKTFPECLSSGHPTRHVWGGSEWDQNSDPAGHGLLGPERRTQFHAHAHRGQAEVYQIPFGFDGYVFMSIGSMFVKCCEKCCSNCIISELVIFSRAHGFEWPA